MTDLPAPLTPVDCDLRDFSYMPLEVARLRDSDLVSSVTPECCFAAVLIWCASWHQIPAASIPNDDKWIADKAGYMSLGRINPKWKKVRDGALHGFIECGDGRLYHATVGEKALEAWIQKLVAQHKSGIGNLKRWGTPFDAEPQLLSAISNARAMLQRLNQQSPVLKKPMPKPSQDNPTGNANGSATGNPTGIAIDQTGPDQDRTNLKPIHTQSTSPPSMFAKFQMRTDWSPDPQTLSDVLRRCGGDPELITPLAIANFTTHWSCEQAAYAEAQWCQKLIDSAKRFAAKNTGGSHEQNRSGGNGSQQRNLSAADRVAANIARERAEREAVAASDHREFVVADGSAVRAQVDQPVRRSGGPGERLGSVLEGDFERSD